MNIVLVSGRYSVTEVIALYQSNRALYHIPTFWGNRHIFVNLIFTPREYFIDGMAGVPMPRASPLSKAVTTVLPPVLWMALTNRYVVSMSVKSTVAVRFAG